MVFKVVCDTAKVRFFKQITTDAAGELDGILLFVILQKYDFSSKSQLVLWIISAAACCLWYCKSTIFQANHNPLNKAPSTLLVVCDTAKVRFFKQITTFVLTGKRNIRLFVILQKYDFSSKSQLVIALMEWYCCCLWYCKSTIFQANHNAMHTRLAMASVVCDTAKVRFFKQITTYVDDGCI